MNEAKLSPIRASRVCMLDSQDNGIVMTRAFTDDPPTAGPIRYSRSQKHKSLKNQWEFGYGEDPERFLTDSEKMLHAQREERVASTLRVDEEKRARKEWQEFNRLAERESEFLEQAKNERVLREKQIGGSQANHSSVAYNIVNRTCAPGYESDLKQYKEDMVEWRKSMRALRLQSKSSGPYNLLSWEPLKPCCIPPRKPETPEPNDLDGPPDTARRPSLARPRDMLHSMTNKCDNVPVTSTIALQTNW